MDKLKVDRTGAESKQAARERLDSWKDIAQYLSRDVRTVQRWERSEGLPVHRLTGSRQKGSPVYAFASEIDAWLHKNPPLFEKVEPDPLKESGPTRNSGRVLWGILIGAILLLGAIWGWRVSHPQVSSPPMLPVSLTTLAGVERYPALSPDGQKIAFSWNGGPELKNPDVYVKFLDGGDPRRLTTNPDVDGWPIWSPNGDLIAFGRWKPGSKTAEIWIKHWLGGAERKIHEFPLPYQAANYWPPGCWTGDGKWLIVNIAPAALGLVSPDTSEVRQLTYPEEGSPGDYGPTLSPDERNLAFLRASSGPVWNLYIQKLGLDYVPEGPPRLLTQETEGVENPMWTGDGREILFISNRDGERALFRIPYDGSRPASRVPTTDKVGYYWAISKSGDRLVYADNKWNNDIWRIDLEGEKEIRRIQSSTRGDLNPQISPDGTRMSFLSDREKGMRLWVSDADGSNPINLAAVNGKRIGPARWSPDGKELVFECRENDRDDICAVPSRGGKNRSLTRSPGRYTLPSWSVDGKWIYVTTNRSGSFQIWKIPSDGSETGARRLTEGGGYAAVESEDGKTVYFSREMMGSNLWSVPADGGEETKIGDFKVSQCYTYAVSPDGIYYISTENREQWFEIWFYRFSDGKSERVSRIPMRFESGMSFSPASPYLLLTAAKEGAADLIMIKNFR